MMELVQFPTSVIAVSGLLIAIITSYIITSLRPGIRTVPGPFWARYSNFWRLANVVDGQYPQKLIKLHKRYGPIVRIGPDQVSISDPEAVPRVYGFTARYLKGPFYDSMSGRYEGAQLHNLFTEQDPKLHRELKTGVSAKYSMASVRTLEPMAEKCTKMFLDIMKELEGKKVDLGEWLQWYTFDVISEMSFQSSFGFMEKRKDVKNMMSSLDKALLYGTFVGYVPWLHRYLIGNDTTMAILTWLFPKAPNPIAYIFDVTLQEMRNYDESGVEAGERRDFLAWIRAEMKNDKNPMTKRDLLTHISTNLLAGSDTTAIVLRAVFYFLIKDPERYRKLQAEIDTADSDGLLSKHITFSECLDMPYLQAVLKEALRLSPPLSMPLERLIPAEGDVICGKQLYHGTTVGISPFVINRDPVVFGNDAEVFRPERWLESKAEDKKAMERTLMAFGSGNRSCMGKNIALLEMSKFIPEVLRRFTLEWASDSPEWRLETYWFMKQSGLYVRFMSRRGPQGLFTSPED